MARMRSRATSSADRLGSKAALVSLRTAARSLNHRLRCVDLRRGPGGRREALCTVYDSDGAPVEVQETIAAADKHQFRYEVAMR